ncbi:hypothetical protein FXO38_08800 [Capsicum annuum]|nr:hypothetical protein FXO38_08800 [Capsicum annuum]
MLSLGFRFHPTDEELINYLKNFVLHGVLPPRDFIKVADQFEDLEPWEIMTGSKKTRYFLSRLKRLKNSTKKFSRTVRKGTWKGQNSGNRIEDGLQKNTTIGYKRSLKYKSDNEKDENNNKWLMKEYFLRDEYFRKSNKNYAFVICKIKEKRKNEKKNKGVTNDEVMEEEADEFIDYVLERIPDNHQVITNHDDNRFAVANEVNYEEIKRMDERTSNTSDFRFSCCIAMGQGCRTSRIEKGISGLYGSGCPSQPGPSLGCDKLGIKSSTASESTGSSRKRKVEAVENVLKNKKIEEAVFESDLELKEISEYVDSSEDVVKRSASGDSEESKGSGRNGADGDNDPSSVSSLSRFIFVECYDLQTIMDELGSFPTMISIRSRMTTYREFKKVLVDQELKKRFKQSYFGYLRNLLEYLKING